MTRSRIPASVPAAAPSLAAAPPPGLSPDDLRRVCDFVYSRTGIAYGEGKRPLIERRLTECMARTGLTSVAAYLALVRGGGADAERLINSFTVNETYFYREEHHLRCLSGALLPDIVRHRGPGDRVRIWSVPCSTGEEPYSIALWLLENWRLVDVYNIEIIGSDIDTRVLDEARAGRFGARALARLPGSVVERYFEPMRDGQRAIIQDLRESVTFTAANLVDAASMAAAGRFDIVFCRNVLIYFDEASRLAAARNIFAALVPGGFVCLGHAESMTRISLEFETRRFDDAIVYQRPPQS